MEMINCDHCKLTSAIPYARMKPTRLKPYVQHAVLSQVVRRRGVVRRGVWRVVGGVGVPAGPDDPQPGAAEDADCLGWRLPRARASAYSLAAHGEPCRALSANTCKAWRALRLAAIQNRTLVVLPEARVRGSRLPRRPGRRCWPGPGGRAHTGQ